LVLDTPGEAFADVALWQVPPAWQEALRREIAVDLSRTRELLDGFHWWQRVPAHGLLMSKDSSMARAVLPDFSRIIAYGTDADVARLCAPEGWAYRGTGLILQVQPSDG